MATVTLMPCVTKCNEGQEDVIASNRTRNGAATHSGQEKNDNVGGYSVATFDPTVRGSSQLAAYEMDAAACVVGITRAACCIHQLCANQGE